MDILYHLASFLYPFQAPHSENVRKSISTPIPNRIESRMAPITRKGRPARKAALTGKTRTQKTHNFGRSSRHRHQSNKRVPHREVEDKPPLSDEMTAVRATYLRERTFRFMGLPPEIREIVYKFVLKSCGSATLSTSRLVHQEAKRFLPGFGVLQLKRRLCTIKDGISEYLIVDPTAED